MADTILLLNDWIASLGLVIKKRFQPDPRPALMLCDRLPLFLYGHDGRVGLPEETLVPVTNDLSIILQLLGFKDDVAKKLERCETHRLRCSLMCSSRYFSPAMVKSTRTVKLGGLSPLAKYVDENMPKIAEAEVPIAMEFIRRVKAQVHRDIEERFPDTVRMKAVSREQMDMVNNVMDATLGASRKQPRSQKANKTTDTYSRWRLFVALHGVLTLHAMPAERSLELWIAFRDDPAAHEHDWQCVHHFA